jgi:hypothetical protein
MSLSRPTTTYSNLTACQSSPPKNECYDCCLCKNIYIQPTPPPVTLISGGTGTSLVMDGLGPDLVIKSISTGPGITFTELDGNIQIGSFDASITLAGAGTTGQDIVADGTGPALLVKNLVATGTGLSITSDENNNIIFENTSPASSVTLAGAGNTGQDIVADGVGSALFVKNLVATGTGLSITSDGNNNIIFENTSPASSVTLSNAVGPSSAQLVQPSPDFGPALVVKTLTSGTGITMTQSPTNIIIEQIVYPAIIFRGVPQTFSSPSFEAQPQPISFQQITPTPVSAAAGIVLTGPTTISLPAGEFIIDFSGQFFFSPGFVPASTPASNSIAIEIISTTTANGTTFNPLVFNTLYDGNRSVSQGIKYLVAYSPGILSLDVNFGSPFSGTVEINPVNMTENTRMTIKRIL